MSGSARGGASNSHQIGLVHYPSFVHAWVLDLPGCITGGPDEASVQRALPRVIAEHVAWLRGHGEHIQSFPTCEVIERVDGAASTAPGGEFCFAWEQKPLSADELEHGIERMAYARADLLDACRHLPDAILDWAPVALDTSGFDAWAPEARTIRGIVEHVLQLEVYYRDSLRDGLASGILERTGDAHSERAITVGLLRSLTDDERSRTYHPTRPSRPTREEWTVRKLVRRIIAHERVHTAEITQRRTWLLLGLPPGMADEW